MTKRKKSQIINSQFETLTKTIQENKEAIANLSLLKNTALLYAKNYQYEINYLKIFIRQFQNILHPDKPVSSNIPLSQNMPIINKFTKNMHFEVTKVDTLRIDEIVCAGKISNNGLYFSFATYSQVFLYKIDKNECIQKVKIPFDSSYAYEKLTRFLTISPDSSFIGLCAADFSLAIFRIPTLDLVNTIKANSPCASFISFFSDNSHLITTAQNGKLVLRTFPNCTEIRSVTLGDNKNIVGISITSDDSIIIATCSDGYVYVINSSLTDTPHSFQTENAFIFSSTLSRSSTNFAITLRNNNVCLYSIFGGFKHLKTLNGHTDYVVCVEFSNDGKLLFTGSKDETIKVWNLESGKDIFTLNHHNNTVFSISHHPKENQFISCSGDGTVSIISYRIH